MRRRLRSAFLAFHDSNDQVCTLTQVLKTRPSTKMVCKNPINEGYGTFCTFCFVKSCQAKKWLVAIPGVEDSIIEHILVCFLGEVTQKVYALMHIKFTSCRVMC